MTVVHLVKILKTGKTQNNLSGLHGRYYAMRAYAVVLLILLTASLVVPVLAAREERYSYITIQDVQIRLDNGSAVIHVNYKVDEGTRFIFFLLGKQDLKNKLMKILNYDDAKMKRIDLSSADFTVEEAALSYGNGIFWYPSHDFNIAIPAAFRQFSPGDPEFYDDAGVSERDGIFCT